MGKLPHSQQFGWGLEWGTCLGHLPSKQPPISPKVDDAILCEDVTDRMRSSGMCKAGFAGDDAPRAVFRKFTPPSVSRSQNIGLPDYCAFTGYRRELTIDPASIVGRPRHHG